MSCELLSEFSIFDTNNNLFFLNKNVFIVVNCFQNSVSLIPTTTFFWWISGVTWLWIAFRIQYLWYQQQLIAIGLQTGYCCELLSEFSIFDTNNNQLNLTVIFVRVVNCFQNSVSLIPTTTIWDWKCSVCLLWIAFRIQYLWYQQQRFAHQPSWPFVVNCFQNSVSLIPTTTGSLVNTTSLMLWIAFRIQYLWYQQQHAYIIIKAITCCELLSEFSIFDTNNNPDVYADIGVEVVNCFQNSVSLIPTTTLRKLWANLKELWIAFRIQYLWYQQQLHQSSCPLMQRCELLSEFSIFDTNNNLQTKEKICYTVVNCFQNSVSLIPTTTWNSHKTGKCQLWIAFRIQYLWYQQQLPMSIEHAFPCCELLSEFSIFDTNNNVSHSSGTPQSVVNCFQNSVSLIPTTTVAT